MDENRGKQVDSNLNSNLDPMSSFYSNNSQVQNKLQQTNFPLASPDHSWSSNSRLISAALEPNSSSHNNSDYSSSWAQNSMVKIIDIQRHQSSTKTRRSNEDSLTSKRNLDEATSELSKQLMMMNEPVSKVLDLNSRIETEEDIKWPSELAGELDCWTNKSRNHQHHHHHQHQQASSTTRNSVPSANNDQPTTSKWSQQGASSNHRASTGVAGQLKQQSGETLSSFESDYDLLVYLGETETEDIVDTERSCDYQDQTWRQSICGGASLAPTIDESLSELVYSPNNPNQLLSSQQTTPVDLETLANTTSSYFSTPNSLSVQQRQQRSNASSNATSTNYQSAASSPYYAKSKIPKLIERTELNTESADECDNQVSLVFDQSYMNKFRDNFSSSSNQLKRNQQQQKTSNNFGNKLASLFHKKSSASSNTQANNNQPLVQGIRREFQADKMVSSSRNYPQQEDYPNPSAAAGELDRLLAEMTSSLDLDSLAKFDPHRQNSSSTSQTLTRFHNKTPQELQYAKSLDRRNQQVYHQQAIRTELDLDFDKKPSNTKYQQTKQELASSESILDEYDGASRILEQMISDSMRDEQRKQAKQSLAKQKTPETAGFSSELEENRKMSTCSSSVTTELSVIAAPKKITGNGPRREPSLYENRSIWKQNAKRSTGNDASPRKISVKSSKITLPSTGLAKSIAFTEFRCQPDKATTLTRVHRINRSRGTSSSSSEEDETKPPPPPPDVDYGDEQEVIRVEAAEIPFSSDDDERRQHHQRDQSSGKQAMERMKRRTLSRMRSMRNKLGDLIGERRPNEPENTTKRSQITREQLEPAPPRPPQRSSSFGSIRSQQLSSKQIDTKSTSVQSPGREERPQERHSRRDDRTHRQQSLGKQIKERLSRSKSRFVDRFLKPKRAQSQPCRPDERESSYQLDDGDNDDRELFEPNDIARNSEEPLKRNKDSFDESLDRHLAKSMDARESVKLKAKSSSSSKASSLSSLSGLEADSAETKGKSRQAIRPKRRSKRNKEPRPRSLSQSIKRLNVLKSNKQNSVEDLDMVKLPRSELGSSSEQVLSDKKNKNNIKRASTQTPPARRRNDEEYFARVSPPNNEKTIKIELESERKELEDRPETVEACDDELVRLAAIEAFNKQLEQQVPPKRSKSKKVSRSHSMKTISVEGCEQSKLQPKNSIAQDKRTVSFNNLNSSRRVPSTTNTFRPASAFSNVPLEPLESQQSRPESVAAINVTPKPIGTNGGVTISEPLMINTSSTSVTPPPLIAPPKSPARKQATNMLLEFKNKCNELLTTATSPVMRRKHLEKNPIELERVDRQRSASKPPSGAGKMYDNNNSLKVPPRPPRKRSKSVGLNERALEREEDEDRYIIELEAASPGSSLTLEEGNSQFSRSGHRSSSRLSSLAHHFKHSAADFFAGNDSKKSKRSLPVRPAPRPPTLEAGREPEKRFGDWEPVIKVSESNKQRMRSPILANLLGGNKSAGKDLSEENVSQKQQASEQVCRRQSTFDTDSTWELSSGGEEAEEEKKKAGTETEARDESAGAGLANLESMAADELQRAKTRNKCKFNEAQASLTADKASRVAVELNNNDVLASESAWNHQRDDENDDGSASASVDKLDWNEKLKLEAKQHEISNSQQMHHHKHQQQQQQLQIPLETSKIPKKFANLDNVTQNLHEICKTPFVFNANLPSPAQVLQASKQEIHLDQTKDSNLKTKQDKEIQLDKLIKADSNLQALLNEPTVVAQMTVNSQEIKNDDQDDEEKQNKENSDLNRLSLYDNVKPQGEKDNSTKVSSKPPPTPQKPPNLRLFNKDATKSLERVKELAEKRSSPPDSPANWSLADENAPLTAPDPGALASRLKLQQQPFDIGLRNSQDELVQSKTEIPRWKLVSMTSIHQDPEDALMHTSSYSTNQQIVSSPSRRDSVFTNNDYEDDNNNNNNSDSDNSFPVASVNRQRLISKFEPLLAGTSNQISKETDNDNLKNKTRGKPPARASPQSSSLVKRLARNFDQTIQEKGVTTENRKPFSSAASIDEASRSESSWYDANLPADDINEAEVAEFLRDFDRSSEQINEKVGIRELSNASGSMDAINSVSTGLDPFVTVAESTIEEDLAEAHETSTADEDDTLNDGVDDDELIDEDLLGESSDKSEKLDRERPEEANENGDFKLNQEESSERQQGKDNRSERSGRSADIVKSEAPSMPPVAVASPKVTVSARENNNPGNSRVASAVFLKAACVAEQQGYHNDDDDHHHQSVTATNEGDHHDNSQLPPPPPQQQNNSHQQQRYQPSNESYSKSTIKTNESKLIDNTFKNSLNNIIARRSSQPQQQDNIETSQKLKEPRKQLKEDNKLSKVKFKTSDDSKFDNLNNHNYNKLTSANERTVSIPTMTSTVAVPKEKGQQQQQQQHKHKQTCESIKSKELKGLSKYCRAILGHRSSSSKKKKHQLAEIGSSSVSKKQIGENVHLCTSSSSSTASSNINSPATSDDEGEPNSTASEANDKDIVKAAKKCSRLYEELERILADRAAKQALQKKMAQKEKADSKLNLINLENQVESSNSTTNVINEREDDGEEGEDEDEDDDEEEDACNEFGSYYDLDRISGVTEDRVSLSSSSVSSESIPEIRQRKNLQKLYCVVNEIYSSEDKFVDTLRLLNEDFRQHILSGQSQSSSSSDLQATISNNHPSTSNKSNIPSDSLNSLLKHLPQLQALSENLLAELKLARDQWPKTQKIAHVLVKIGPFLKHYSTYIREFELMSQQFQEAIKKYPLFNERVREFEASNRCQKLSIQHHLLKPVQRIPQYRLLLQQYLHHLKPDDVDYEDTVNALEVVSRVAEHANQSMNEGANFAKLLALQAKIVGKQKNIVQPGRLFVKEGELMKVCRKQIQPRWFVLLSDALLYLTQIQASDILYLNKELPLDDCTITIPETREQVRGNSEQHFDREFNVCTKTRAFALIAKTPAERDEWVQVFKNTIEEYMARRRSFSVRQQQLFASSSPSSVIFANCPPQIQDSQANNTNTNANNNDNSSLSTNPNNLLGQKAPLWTPDSRVTMCQSCTSSFSAIFRRHHCRACGKVVCSACSSNKAPLIYLKCRSARVCDQCFDILKANIHLYYLPTNNINNNDDSTNQQHQLNNHQVNEQELKRLDELFRTLLKSQFVRHARLHGLSRLLKF